MEIKIGVQHVARELTIETEQTVEQIEQSFRDSLLTDAVLTIKAAKGRQLLIPANKVGYIDFGPAVNRPVGFGLGAEDSAPQ